MPHGRRPRRLYLSFLLFLLLATSHGAPQRFAIDYLCVVAKDLVTFQRAVARSGSKRTRADRGSATQLRPPTPRASTPAFAGCHRHRASYAPAVSPEACGRPESPASPAGTASPPLRASSD